METTSPLFDRGGLGHDTWLKLRAVELAVEFSKTKNTSTKDFEEIIKIINKYLNVSNTDLH